MIHTAIIDDEATARENLKECLKIVEKKEGVTFDVHEFTNAEQFLFHYEEGFELLFMDIMMTGEDGLSAAKRIREKNKTVTIIFITNMAQMAVYGYDVDALDFIIKPINREMFCLKMKRALGRIQKNEERRVLLNAGGQTVALSLDSIRWIENQGHYVVYHTTEGIYSEYITLTNAKKKLCSPLFIHCNRGTVLNLRYLTSVGKDTCRVNGDDLYVSAPLRKPVMEAFTAYLGGMLT